MDFDYAEKIFSKPLTTKRKKLLFYRVEVLKRNLLFQKDYEKLKKLEEANNFPGYLKEKELIRKRWGIDSHGFPIDADPSVQKIDLRPSGFITLKINLNYPKERILLQVKEEIDWCWSEYRLRKDEPDFAADRKADNADINELKGTTWDKKRKPEELYDLYLTVYDMRENTQGIKTWKHIIDTLNIATTQDARNYYNAACKLIKKGVPGFQPFPDK